MSRVNIFTILQPQVLGGFAAQLESLKSELEAYLHAHGLTTDRMVMSHVCLTDAANQLAELKQHPLYTDFLVASGFSFVEQPLLDGRKVALQLWFINRPDVVKTQLEDTLLVEVGGEKLLFQSVRFSEQESKTMDAEAQTREAFLRHVALLGEHGMTLRDNCHRTWIYVRDIDRHYAGVVRGRNVLFAEEGLTVDTHFIASTGIGGYGDNREAAVCMDFLSMSSGLAQGVKYLQATDYLNPTAEYGVAFERGTALTLLGERLRFISGTASIDRHGECLYRGDILAQTERLFLNIEKLLEADSSSLADLSYMVVYLRDVADCAVVCAYMQERFPAVSYVIVEARVCRPEWLVEVEGIAVSLQ